MLDLRRQPVDGRVAGGHVRADLARERVEAAAAADQGGDLAGNAQLDGLAVAIGSGPGGRSTIYRLVARQQRRGGDE
jgi:hypothetical protein